MQISSGKLIVLLVAVGLAFGGIGAALADGGQDDSGQPQPVQLADDDARKDDADGEAAVVVDDDDDDDDTGGGDTNGTAVGAAPAPALIEGRTAAQWMRTANLYKQRWLKMKLSNHRHAQQVRNLRAARSQARSQPRYSSSPRVARGGGGGTGGGTNTGGGGTGTGGGDT